MHTKIFLAAMIFFIVLAPSVEARPVNLPLTSQPEAFIFPDVVYKQTVEYLYTLETIASEEYLPLISAIVTSFDGSGNMIAIELKDREALTMTERLLEDLAQDIVLGNMEKEVVSIRYELNMIGEPVSADIVYFDIGELTE